jgi:hemin uptake protein HemP
MSKNNQTGIAEIDHYVRFEALPARFRQMLRHSSHDMTVGWCEQLIAHHGEEDALRIARARLAELRRRTIVQHYGPNHPQLERRA